MGSNTSLNDFARSMVWVGQAALAGRRLSEAYAGRSMFYRYDWAHHIAGIKTCLPGGESKPKGTGGAPCTAGDVRSLIKLKESLANHKQQAERLTHLQPDAQSVSDRLVLSAQLSIDRILALK